MFSDDRDDVARELAQRGSDALVEALERVGVYVQSRQVVAHPARGTTGLFVTGVLGRVAFSDRVQNPDQEAVDALFQDMTDNLVETEFEERRRELDD